MAAFRVLFVCVGNTCRSPMAEAMARALGEGEIEAFSAGLAPTGMIAGHTRSALRQLGYRDDGLASKGLHDVPFGDVDLVVSLLGPEGLRVLPTGMRARRLAWRIPDPYGEEEAVYLAVARRIERSVRSLVLELRGGRGVTRSGT